MSKPLIDHGMDIPDHILKQLLTPSEVRMLKNRWHIIQLLKEGLTVRNIAEKVKVGTDTVVRASKMMGQASMRKALSGTSQKNIKAQTPWVFGKND
jgi:Trp operon repressor